MSAELGYANRRPTRGPRSLDRRFFDLDVPTLPQGAETEQDTAARDRAAALAVCAAATDVDDARALLRQLGLITEAPAPQPAPALAAAGGRR